MKIRTGFVSNSSSSSFILPQNSIFKSIFNIAKIMIPGRYDKDNGNYEMLLKIATVQKDNPNVEGIFFESCNYNTYIAKHNECFLVSTCNNVSWDDILYKHHIKDQNHFHYELGDDLYNIKHLFDFYSLESDIIGRNVEYIYRYYCRCCYEYGWVSGNKYMCPICGKELTRKDVL